jgi:hypothetical protein
MDICMREICIPARRLRGAGECTTVRAQAS